MITIAIQCHNFQHRLCWMISSLFDQTSTAPPITLDIAFHKGNGNPTTLRVIEYFSKLVDITGKTDRLKFILREFTEKESHTFNHRGLLRNIQLTECRDPWLLFSDSDMVYHPEFFGNLAKELTTTHKFASYMLTCGRMSGEREKFEKEVDSLTYPVRVEKGYDTLKPFATRPMRNVGAGFFQLINMKYASHGGFYVLPDQCRDWNMQKKGSNPKSDMQFRKRIGKKVALPSWFSENQYHVNHRRDPEEKKHITLQR